MSNVHKGRIKFYKPMAGFGYITYWIGNERKTIYTHASQFINGTRDIIIGQKVRFTIGMNERGEIAQNVEVIEDAKVKTNT